TATTPATSAAATAASTAFPPDASTSAPAWAAWGCPTTQPLRSPDCLGSGAPSPAPARALPRTAPPARFNIFRRSYLLAMMRTVCPGPQPESHVMTPFLRLRMIFESRAVVQNPAVIDKEHLPALQVKFRPEFAPTQQTIEYVQRLDLGRG